MNFGWDATKAHLTKAHLNVIEHGVSFEDAITVFDDIFSYIANVRSMCTLRLNVYLLVDVTFTLVYWLP